MKMNRLLAVLLCAALAMMSLAGFAALAESGAGSGFAYEHDPRENPNAMKDIVENPDAVYGFSPSPDSTRLKEYADAIDWTDPEQVAEARAVRQSYHDSSLGGYPACDYRVHTDTGDHCGRLYDGDRRHCKEDSSWSVTQSCPCRAGRRFGRPRPRRRWRTSKSHTSTITAIPATAM